MKKFLLTILGVHLVFASLCISQVDHALADSTDMSHTQSAQHDCDDCHHDASKEHLPCAGGHCITEASAPIMNTFVSPQIQVAFSPFALDYHRSLEHSFDAKENSAPLVVPLQTSTVLIL